MAAVLPVLVVSFMTAIFLFEGFVAVGSAVPPDNMARGPEGLGRDVEGLQGGEAAPLDHGGQERRRPLVDQPSQQLFQDKLLLLAVVIKDEEEGQALGRVILLPFARVCERHHLALRKQNSEMTLCETQLLPYGRCAGIFPYGCRGAGAVGMATEEKGERAAGGGLRCGGARVDTQRR